MTILLFLIWGNTLFANEDFKSKTANLVFSCQQDNGGWKSITNISDLNLTLKAVAIIRGLGEDPKNWVTNGKTPQDFFNDKLRSIKTNEEKEDGYPYIALALYLMNLDITNYPTPNGSVDFVEYFVN